MAVFVGQKGTIGAWVRIVLFGSGFTLLAASSPGQNSALAEAGVSPPTQLLAQVQAAAPAPTADSSAVAPATTVESSEIRATTRAAAIQQAKMGAGRANPFARIQGFKPFPSNAPVKGQKIEVKKRAMMVPPPPPPNTTSIFNATTVPAPPPEDVLPAGELPAPPEKPSLAGKMELLGIVGDRAIFRISDPTLRQENGWPKSVTLGAGDQFETVSVVGITPNAVTLEEDGDRQVKQIPRIK